MTAVAGESSRIVLGVDDNPGAGLRGHAMAPILIGLAVPLLVVHLFAPKGLADFKAIVVMGLGALAVISFVMFIASMVFAGDISAVSIDPKSRKATVTYSGLFASTEFEVPFSQISDVKVSTEYDRDGYSFVSAHLALKDGQQFELPAATTEADIVAARAALGRH